MLRALRATDDYVDYERDTAGLLFDAAAAFRRFAAAAMPAAARRRRRHDTLILPPPEIISSYFAAFTCRAITRYAADDAAARLARFRY